MTHVNRNGEGMNTFVLRILIGFVVGLGAGYALDKLGIIKFSDE